MRTILAGLWEELAEKVYQAQGLEGTAAVYRQAAQGLREAAAAQRPLRAGEEQDILRAIREAQVRLAAMA